MRPTKKRTRRDPREVTQKACMPGRKWRLLAQERGGRSVQVESAGQFDELVVDSWLHIEQMSPRHYWMRIGPLTVNVGLLPDGTVDAHVLREAGSKARVECTGDLGGESDGLPWFGRDE